MRVQAVSLMRALLKIVIEVLTIAPVYIDFPVVVGMTIVTHGPTTWNLSTKP